MAQDGSVRAHDEPEPTLEKWHAALSSIVGEEPPVVQEIVEFSLRVSKSGTAYLEGAKRLRPNLEIGPDIDLDEIVATYDAATLLSQLIAEPRCGTDPHFYIWKDIWKCSFVGASDLYGLAIEISRTLEARARTEAETARIQQVRAAIENELHLEKYHDWRLETARELAL